MKQQYLAVYDYGTGGLWGLIKARSQDEIATKYPTLRVVDIRPAWMTDAIYSEIVTHNAFDIGDPPTGWLAEI